jgi:glycosyltransferase involved in cell wall biosynthesis
MISVSFIISTYNRRDVLLKTLQQIKFCGLSKESFEILLIDNASPDQTATAVAQSHPDIHLFALRDNLGPCAKNLAIPKAQGQYIIFLDDDSYPEPNSVERMIQHFQRKPKLGAAVFTITLPDGSRECSAYPDVFIGCGTGFRREALLQVGGLPTDFFMQAEEYDLSLRLLDAGWRVQTFDDLKVSHLKTPGARYSERVTQFDVRNNLVLLTRYFPEEWMLPFAMDWMKRYYMIASTKGHKRAYLKGLVQGIVRSISTTSRNPIAHSTFESFTRMESIQQKMRAAQNELGLKRILFIDLGKNILPFYLAARTCNLEVVAIADPKLANTKNQYHQIRIVDDATASNLPFDAAIISNLSPIHAANRQAIWQRLTNRPVLDFFTTHSALHAA